MKTKKKGSSILKKGGKKPLPKHQLFLIDKTLITTKEKTHNTIQEPVQIKDIKSGPRSARNHIHKISCSQKMQQYNISPFSSPGKNSFSPRCRKTLSPFMKDERQKVKLKAKGKNNNQKGQKKKVETERREGKLKQKMTKQQCNFAYQNQFLKKLEEKKITQMSQQSEHSVAKIKKKNINLKLDFGNNQDVLEKARKDRIKELHRKIKSQYRKQFPSFTTYEVTFISSLVLLQKLWKQRKMKKMINDFISPRSNPEFSITNDLLRDSNNPGLDFTLTTQAQTSELIRKYHNFSLQKKKNIKEDMVQEVHSAQLHKNDEKTNLKDLQLSSSQLSPQKQTKMVHFVECLRDITFHKPQKSTKQSRINVFNLQESLSQKCLMQSFYQRIFKPSPSKKSNFEIFKERKEEKNLQRSIELINSMGSPKKQEVVIIDERCETELQSKDAIEVKQPVQTVSIHVETDPDFLEDQHSSKEINSLKQLNQISQAIISQLMNEFGEEYHEFATKSTLKKKKKSTLPGLRSSQNSIKEYLIGLTNYMMKEYGQEITRRFSLIKPLSFLKIHHQYDQDEEIYEEQEDQDINLPIVPQTLYYEYQQMYEAEHFIIPESQKKYSNFLESLIKIHNLLLINCLSEMIQKTRMDKIILPWDNKMDTMRNKDHKCTQKTVKSIISSIINSICKSAFMRVGQFHKSIEHDSVQEQRLLKSIHMQYKNEGSDWSTQYEYLELRMDLTKHVEEIILDEIAKELMIFI